MTGPAGIVYRTPRSRRMARRPRARPWASIQLRRERVGQDVDTALDGGPRAGAVRGMGDDELAASMRRVGRRANDLDRHHDDRLTRGPRPGEQLDAVRAAIQD